MSGPNEDAIAKTNWNRLEPAEAAPHCPDCPQLTNPDGPCWCDEIRRDAERDAEADHFEARRKEIA